MFKYAFFILLGGLGAIANARAEDVPGQVLPTVPLELRNSVKLEWRDADLEDPSRSVMIKLKGVEISDVECRQVLTIQKVKEKIDFVDAFNVKRLTDQQVQILSTLPDLRWIIIRGKSVTDRCTISLADSPSLEMVDLCGTNITDAGVARLAVLKKLRTLSLSDSLICGSEVSKLREFPALETLRCEHTPADSRICEELIRIRTLKQLHLNGTKVGDDAIGSLRRCENLEALYLGKLPQLTFAGFREVIRLPKLRIVNLDHCRVEDAWLDAIPAGSSIQELYLTGDAPYTLPAINRLQRRNPKMSVFHGRIVKPKAKPGEVTRAEPRGTHSCFYDSLAKHNEEVGR